MLPLHYRRSYMKCPPPYVVIDDESERGQGVRMSSVFLGEAGVAGGVSP